MCSIGFRRRPTAVSLVLTGALLWHGAERAAAQVRPDAPGSTPVVRLDEPRIHTAAGSRVDGRAARARREVRLAGAHRQRLPDHAARPGTGRGGNAVRPLHVDRLDPVGAPPRAAGPADGLADPVELPLGRPRADRPGSRRHARRGTIASPKGPGAAGWDPFEATLLRLADELYVNSSVRDATWDALAARYDLYNLFDAVMAVNETTLVAMLYNSWGVQPDDNAYARFPADVPYTAGACRRPSRRSTTPRVAPLEGARHPGRAAPSAATPRCRPRVAGSPGT